MQRSSTLGMQLALLVNVDFVCSPRKTLDCFILLLRIKSLSHVSWKYKEASNANHRAVMPSHDANAVAMYYCTDCIHSLVLFTLYKKIHQTRVNERRKKKYTFAIDTKIDGMWSWRATFFASIKCFCFFFVLFFGCLSLCERALVAQNAINQSEYLSGLPFSRAFALILIQ